MGERFEEALRYRAFLAAEGGHDEAAKRLLGHLERSRVRALGHPGSTEYLCRKAERAWRKADHPVQQIIELRPERMGPTELTAAVEEMARAGLFLGAKSVVPDNTARHYYFSGTEIGPHAFSNRWDLIQLEIMPRVTKICNYAFAACDGLRIVRLHHGITQIDCNAFEDCWYLTRFDCPVGVTTIAAHAFRGCHDLIEASLHPGVAAIGQYAFADCCSMRAFVMPPQVAELQQCAFQNCRSLVSI